MPARKRRLVGYINDTYKTSMRRDCELARISRATAYYRSSKRSRGELRVRLRDFAAFRVLTLVDHFTRESPASEVGSSLTGERVVDVRERLARSRGLPQVITTDNGTEFPSRAVDEWAHRSGVKLAFIRPGKPHENAYIDCFNGRLCRECLDESWFLSIEDVKIKIEQWRRDYNEHRQHGSLGDETPRRFSEIWQLYRAAETAGILT